MSIYMTEFNNKLYRLKMNTPGQKRRRLLLSAASVLTASALILTNAGCKDSVNASEIDKKTIPSKDVSFKNDIQPVFDLKCNYSGCHDDGSRAGGLSLTSWANTTSSMDIVFPGEPQNSRLIQSIKAGAVYPMPPDGYPPLTTNQIDGITTWVKEGAKNN